MRRIYESTGPESLARSGESNKAQINLQPLFSIGALEEILKIARERATLLEVLKQAVLEDDVAAIKQAAARYCGLDYRQPIERVGVGKSGG